jgi:hypothetical protein
MSWTRWLAGGTTRSASVAFMKRLQAIVPAHIGVELECAGNSVCITWHYILNGQPRTYVHQTVLERLDHDLSLLEKELPARLLQMRLEDV